MIKVLYNTVNITEKKKAHIVKYSQQITELKKKKKLEWSNIMSNFKNVEKWQYKKGQFHQLETRQWYIGTKTQRGQVCREWMSSYKISQLGPKAIRQYDTQVSQNRKIKCSSITF